MAIGTGADVKTIQELARHSTPHLTMNIYGRAIDSHLVHAAGKIGDMIFSRGEAANPMTSRTNSVQVSDQAETTKSATHYSIESCAQNILISAGGIEGNLFDKEGMPQSGRFSEKARQENLDLCQSKGDGNGQEDGIETDATGSMTDATAFRNTKFIQASSKFRTSVFEKTVEITDPNLLIIFETWDILPGVIKASILATIKAAVGYAVQETSSRYLPRITALLHNLPSETRDMVMEMLEVATKNQ